MGSSYVFILFTLYKVGIEARNDDWKEIWGEVLTDARPTFRSEVSEVGDYWVSGNMFAEAVALKIGLLRAWAILNRWKSIYFVWQMLCLRNVFII